MGDQIQMVAAGTAVAIGFTMAIVALTQSEYVLAAWASVSAGWAIMYMIEHAAS